MSNANVESFHSMFARAPHDSAPTFRISRDRNSGLGFLCNPTAQEKSRISAEDWLLQNSLCFALDRELCSSGLRGIPQRIYDRFDTGRCCVAVWTRLGPIPSGNSHCAFCRPDISVMYNRGLEEAEKSTTYLSLSRSPEIVRLFLPGDPDGATVVGLGLHHRRLL